MNLQEKVAERAKLVRKPTPYFQVESERRERLRKMTEDLILSVLQSPIALKRLSGPIEKR